MKKHIKRGEIYLADLNPYQGSEQGGIDLYLFFKMTLETYIVIQQLLLH